MIDRAVHPADGENVEAVLRQEIARGDAMAEVAHPILRQLLVADSRSTLGDEIMAHIRGMLEHIASILSDALSDPAGPDVEALTRALIDNPALLSHLRAMALEWQVTEHLQARLALDPVVPTLLQELISRENAIREVAVKFLAAQARWCQSQQRMRLPLMELPGELFHAVLLILRSQVAHHPSAAERAARAEAELRKCYDEGARRLDLAGQLVQEFEGGARAALSVSHAGVALFLTALALGSGQDRDAVVFSTDGAQLVRLALTLRSAGLETAEVERQLLALHPETTLPPGLEGIDSGLASAMLASGSRGS